MPMVSKLGKVMTCPEKLQNLKLHELVLVMLEIDRFITSFSKNVWLLNLVGCWLQGGGSEYKRPSRYLLLVIFLFTTLSNSQIQ